MSINTRKSIVLVHYPCVDKNGELYTTAITNMDVHDIARSACTYGIDNYYIISPITAQRDLTQTMVDYWQEEKSIKKNPDRAKALSRIVVLKTLEEAVLAEEKILGKPPLLISTSAKEFENKTITYSKGSEILKEKDSLIIFGTGYGLASSILDKSDYILRPIYGYQGYNHLSVRSAAAIIMDRLLGRDNEKMFLGQGR